MGIKAGSGRGGIDRGGSKENVPAGVGSSKKRDRVQFPPPPPKKPLQPIESPFPEKPGFRLGQYRVLEEKDDYLLCTGFDPNAEVPGAEVTPSAFRSGVLMKVAKPPALQRTVWEDAGEVTIGGIAYTYEYSDSEKGVRTARWTDADGAEREEEQRIDIPYVVDSDIGDIIVAVQIKKNAWVEGMEVTDEDGTRLRWIDLNVSGRHWTPSLVEEDVDDSFPPGSPVGCWSPCMSNCLEGDTIEDAGGQECCESHLRWLLRNPWFVCDDKDLVLEYISSHVWLTESFTAPNGNVYQWKLTIDVDGVSYLTLVLVTDNGGADVCLVFAREGFNCLCMNTFTTEKPYGVYHGIYRNHFSCSACIVPDTLFDPTAGFSPAAWACDTGNTLSSVPPSVVFSVNGATLVNSPGPPACCAGIDVEFLNTHAILVPYQSTSYNSDGQITSVTYHFDGTINGQVVDLRVTYGCGASLILSIDGCLVLLMWNYLAPAVPTTATDPNSSNAFPFGDLPCATAGTGWPYVGSNPGTITVSGEGITLPTQNVPTTTGSCADASCTDTAAPADPDAGCCCYQNQTFDYWDETLCASFGGTWSSDCSKICNPEGVCCLNGECFVAAQYPCEFMRDANGDPAVFVEGGDCATNPCSGGACCRDAGTCDATTEADCQGTGEYFHGLGTACVDFDCTMTACCSGPAVPAGECACSDSTVAGCSGQELGRGTTCADTDGYTCTNYPDVDCGWQPP